MQIEKHNEKNRESKTPLLSQAEFERSSILVGESIENFYEPSCVLDFYLKDLKEHDERTLISRLHELLQHYNQNKEWNEDPDHRIR